MTSTAGTGRRLSGPPRPGQRRPTLPEKVVVGRRAGKAAAILAVVCGLIHIPVLFSHLGTFPGTSLLMLILSCACLPCAKSLWNAPLLRDWGTVATISGSMLVLHSLMMQGMKMPSKLADGVTGMAEHHHSSMTMPDGGAQMDMHGLGALLLDTATALAVSQLVLAAAVMIVARVRRGRVSDGLK